MIAEIRESEGQLQPAHVALTEADELEPSAARAYRLGLLAQHAEDYSQAIDDYRRAVARDPDNVLYEKSLVYAYLRAGSRDQAQELLEQIIARHPNEIAAYRELAYSQLALGHQAEAAGTLRAGIDAQLANPATPGSEHASDELWAMRTEHESLTRRFEGIVYESYRPRGGLPLGDSLGEGIIPSQGGAELWYFPTGALGRTDSALQLGARFLWANSPAGGLGIDDKSTLGSVSVRYKPLRESDLFFGVERLIKVGALTENDWLLRTSFGLGHDIAPRQGKTLWNYWQLYAEAGYFLRSKTEATYLEAREGITLPATSSFLITPHLVVAYRQQNPDPSRLTIAEGGPGIAFKYVFGGSRYDAHGPTFDLLLQYRQRLSGQGQSDWVVTGILHF
jgi:tetratricopeptide (TPR) repeat protein